MPAVHKKARPNSSGASSIDDDDDTSCLRHSETADDWSRCHHGFMHHADLEKLLRILTVSAKAATNFSVDLS